MIRILLFTALLLANGFCFSQQDPQFSQYLFNYSAINPGYVGSNDQYRATAVHRTQWMGFEGAPTTLNLNVEGAVPGIHGGVGLNVILIAFFGEHTLLLILLNYNLIPRNIYYLVILMIYILSLY